MDILPGNDVITALWSKNASEKCRLGLTDTVLYERGAPVRWYITGKNGEILKKRKIDKKAISDRWRRIASQNNTPVIAIIRQKGNILKFLNDDAWQAFADGMQFSDDSILSVHCFIKSKLHTINRNNFELKDKTGRSLTSTYSYSYNIDESDPESITIFHENSARMYECKATNITNIMDLATSTVIRYLEIMLNIKVLKISIDYIIDQKSQLWMMWSSDAKIVYSNQLTDIPGLPSGDRSGRMSWAGPKYFEAKLDSQLQEEEEQQQQQDLNNSTSLRSMSSSTTTNYMLQKNGNLNSTWNTNEFDKKADFPLAASQLQAASLTLDNSVLESQTSLIQDSKRRSKLVNSAPLSSPRNIFLSSENNQQIQGKFPDPFKCHGDYCNIQMRPVGSLTTDKSTKEHSLEKIFTSKELGIMRKSPNYNRMMDFTATNGPGFAVITQKSIILARKERRNLTIDKSEDIEDWRNYPITPRQNSAEALRAEIEMATSTTTKAERELAARSAQVDHDLKAEQDFQEMLEMDKQHRESFTKSVATYYEQVRVCPVCYKVYMVLDWARDILEHESNNNNGNNGNNTHLPRSKRGQRDNSTNNTNNINSINSDSLTDKNKSVKLDKIQGNSIKSSKSESQLSTSSKNNINHNSLNNSNISLDKLDQYDNPSMITNSSNITNSTQNNKSIVKELPDNNNNNSNSNTYNNNKKSTWKNYRQKGIKDETFEREKFADLDDYLRGGTEVLADRKRKEKDALVKKRINQLQQESSLEESELLKGNSNISPDKLYRGKVLLACSEGQVLVDTKYILENAFFDVYWVPDGLQALNDLYKEGSKKDSEFDCLIIERNCPLHDAFQVVNKVREQEKLIRRTAAAKEAARGRGIQPFTRRLPVICFTSETLPTDLQAYMKADMDGCISIPPNKTSLINTVRAAIPHHLASINGPSLEELNKPKQSLFPQSFKQGILGTIEGSTDSATTAAKQLVVAAGSSNDTDLTISGIVQIDADTRVPYMVMDFSRTSKVQVSNNRPFFNLIVCHDLFDTAEKLKIFFKPIAQKYLGMQILLWNYPGQAFTEWRPEQLLNNEYHSTCLNEVIGQVGEKGTKDFDTTRPFYMMGYGHGSSILSFYTSHYNVPNLRGLININGWSFLDSYLAGAMHDCINVFQAAPSSRPDLPVYFFSRFLFSKDYLAKVSVPLALNLYTAVHNPISLQGRLGLCKGVLHAIDVRTVLKEIDCPIICIQSTQDAFARPLHTEPYVTYRGGEVRSIFKSLINPEKTCVIWIKSGHEIFQEARKQTQTLLEQILTGFHESNDISFPTAPVVDKSIQSSSIISNRAGENEKQYHMSVEDKFIDTVLDNLKSTTTNSSSSHGERDKNLLNANMKHFTNNTSEEVQQSWEDYAVHLAENQIIHHSSSSSTLLKKNLKSSSSTTTTASSLKKLEQPSFLTFDASSTLFEKQDSQFYNPKDLAKNYSARVTDFPEVKEYMGWRLKRNKKRLQRLQVAARTIQGAFRAHIARQLVRGIRRRKAAMTIQRCFRGWLGRCSFLNQARRIWGTLTIQRAWRGYLGRKWYYNMRLQIAASATIQRYWRGYVAREYVKEIHHQRYLAACRIQSIFRRNQARRDAWNRRQRRNAATSIQRMYRGHLGRRKASTERDKYIFSKSQTQGIEFGRQMLLEHKLHATKLQSDVTLLTQEKVAAEEQVEALLEEITSFEEGVRILEKEMHQLAKVEVEAASYMDEESKYELREQKMRLDREFGDMLSKIGNRKDMLSDLEVKLSTIDKSRQMKEEELRTLERKLVVLLEEQQNELKAIKRKQDVRGALLAASHDQLMKASSNINNGQLQITNGTIDNNNGNGSMSNGNGNNQLTVGGGGFTGPSMKEKQQVAQLMQSTETLMKFGFMSMSMTYFSSLNMIKAMRTVSAQDTVMAALADTQSQRAANAIPTSTNGVVVGNGGVGTSGQFLPELKKGQLPGQEALNVSSWSVEDVSRWLQTLSLGQYSEAFIDAAVDGEFLYDLNDDDLKNTLGVEHRLHRKKILNCVHRLKIAEASRDARVGNMLREMGTDQPQTVAGPESEIFFPALQYAEDDGSSSITSNENNRRMIDGPQISLAELFSLVRHSKYSLLKEALDYLPNKDFDKSLVKVPYIEDFGTSYIDGYEKLAFHVNKTDEHGNTMLTLACQNGNVKVSKYLMAKGANPNHQNLLGQTPAHFCIAYQFYDLSHWLFENGALDTIENKYGLTPYDGLAPS